MKKKVPTEKEIASKHGVSVDYVIRQAEMGSTVEREHVTTHEEAYGIALQHVMEFPDYYKHLLPMEKKLKQEWKKKKTVKEMWEAANAAQQAAIAISKKKKMKEDHIPIAMGKMLDSEGGMIKNQLETIERSVELLRAQIKSDDMQIPAWVQAKVTLATENILTCANYMAGKDEEVKKEEIVYEAKKSKKDSDNSDDDDSSDDDDDMNEGAAWTKKSGQNKNGGLNEKGRKSYEKEHPGSDLKAPSKKVGNPRRASFCARMKGMRKRQKDSNNTGEDRLSKSLRAWNC